MSGAKFTDEFKRDAVAQVEDRGYPVREVAERLGSVAPFSGMQACPARQQADQYEAIAEREHQVDHTWQKQFSRPAKVIQEFDAQADEIRRLKPDLLRVTEERDILK